MFRTTELVKFKFISRYILLEQPQDEQASELFIDLDEYPDFYFIELLITINLN